jgi:hypothetical protein
MEDVGLVRRLRKRGRLVVADETVTTGTRHWDALGPTRTTLLNWIAVSLYFSGVSPTRLSPLYHRLRKKRRAKAAGDQLPVTSNR